MRKVSRSNDLGHPVPGFSQRTSKRRGFVSMQLIFILPLLVITTIAVVQFGKQIVARETISASATAGARTAARGGDVRDVTRSVARALATDKIGVSEHGHTVIVIEKYGEKPKWSGNADVKCNPAGPKLKLGEVRVTVCVRGGKNGSARIPNWFGSMGRPMSLRRIQSSALLTVE